MARFLTEQKPLAHEANKFPIQLLTHPSTKRPQHRVLSRQVRKEPPTRSSQAMSQASVPLMVFHDQSRRLQTFAPDTAHRLRSQPSGPLDPALEHFVSLYRALALPGHLLSSSSWSPRRPRSNSASRRGALAHKNVPSEHALASLSPPPSGSKKPPSYHASVE